MSDGDKKKTGPKKNSAEELIKQAEERLKARFIGTKHKHEDAVKLYQQAAALYKMEGDCAYSLRSATTASAGSTFDQLLFASLV